MSAIKYESFRAARPKAAPHLLPAGMAQGAENCLFRRGSIEPLNELSTGFAASASIKTLRKYAGDGFDWLGWTSDVSVVRSVVPGDADSRIYWADGTQPKQSSHTRLGSGSSILVDPDSSHSYPLGVPAPVSPPSITLDGAPPADEAITRTYVYAWEYGGALGAKSDPFTGTLAANTPNGALYLSGLATSPTGATADGKVMWGGKRLNISSMKKWLFLYDSSTSQYVLLGKLEPGDSDYLDDGTVWIHPTTKQPVHKKAAAFNAALMAAPAAGAASSNAAPSGTTVTRYYLYCFVYELDKVWYRTPSSAAGSLADVLDGDAVVVSGMDLPLSGDIPANAASVKRAIFRRDGAGVGAEKLVALIPTTQTEYTDRKKTAKLGKLLSAYSLAGGTAGGVPTLARLGTTSENYDTETRFYVWTYVTDWDEEGPPSPPSAAVELPPWLWPVVTVRGLPSGYPNINTARLYRTNLNGDYQLVTELPGNFAVGAQYTDHVSASDLGAAPVLSTMDYDPPPADLHALVALPGGVLAGLSGRVLCFSEPGLPYAWPVKYRQSMDYEGVALGVGSGGLWVGTTGTPYLCQGADPAQMTLYKIDQQHACVSSTSMVDMGEFVIYATPDGLAAAAGGAVRLLTGDVLTRDQWQAYSPADIRAYLHEGRYVAFNGAAGFIFDPQEPTITDITGIVAGAGYTDPEMDVLYLRVGSAVVQWRGGTGRLTGVWRSGRLVSDVPITPTAARVDAEGYPVTFKLYSDGVLKHTQSVADAAPFRLPAGYRGRAFEIEISGTNEVRRVLVGEGMGDVVG